MFSSVQAKRALTNFKVRTSPTNTEYKITGLSEKICKELMYYSTTFNLALCYIVDGVSMLLKIIFLPISVSICDLVGFFRSRKGKKMRMESHK